MASFIARAILEYIYSHWKLAQDHLIRDLVNEAKFSEAYVKDKHKKTNFSTCERNHSAEPVTLVHSDFSGKMNARSFGGGEYSHLH